MSHQTKTPLALCMQKDSQAGSQARGTGTSQVSIIPRTNAKTQRSKRRITEARARNYWQTVYGRDAEVASRGGHTWMEVHHG